MSVILPRQAIDFVSQSADPKAEMMKKVGDLSKIELMFNQVLVAQYVRPQKTKGGIIRPTENLEEDVWQGKVGLVIALGPNAFQDDADFSFFGQKVEMGEWIAYKIGDTFQLTVGEWPCRCIRDSSIKMKLANPEIVL